MFDVSIILLYCDYTSDHVILFIIILENEHMRDSGFSDEQECQETKIYEDKEVQVHLTG